MKVVSKKCICCARAADANPRPTKDYSVEIPSWSTPTTPPQAECKASSGDTRTVFVITVPSRTGKYAGIRQFNGVLIRAPVQFLPSEYGTVCQANDGIDEIEGRKVICSIAAAKRC